MPEIETRREDLRGLPGLHLWHAGLSNCSQRVRLVLEEKHLPWTSHMVDLRTFEHATPEYQLIHPKGLVPTLLHDGRTIIDSNDIIVYLNERFPEIPLGLTVTADMRELLDMASHIQLALRVLSHELLLGDLRRLDQETLARFERSHSNREFYQFLKRFSTEGFDDDHLASLLQEMDSALELLDGRLKDSAYLAGETVSVADFSWVVNIHRLSLFDYPLSRFEALPRWFAAMKARPSYARALTAYETSIPVADAKMRDRRDRLFAQL